LDAFGPLELRFIFNLDGVMGKGMGHEVNAGKIKATFRAYVRHR